MFIKQFLYKYVIIIIIDVVLKILQPNETYKGRGYSEWLEDWANLMVSASPDTQSGTDMLFFRGDLEYAGSEKGKIYVEHEHEHEPYLDVTGDVGQSVYKNTALFAPVMTAMYWINDVYEGRQLLDEAALRYAVRKDTSESRKIWFRYRYSKSEFQPVISGPRGIKDYYFETPVFSLNISSENPFLEKYEHPLIPGQYEAVLGGYFVILKDLEKGPYRFHFGGYGRGFYVTDSVYDINVLDLESRDLVEDVSKISPSPGIRGKKTFRHLKTESDIDAVSPFP